MKICVSLAFLGLFLTQTGAAPVGTAFTYQGRLADGTNAANGLYDLNFALYDDPTGGSQIGTNVTLNGRLVSNGLFTVTLDFGDGPFDGQARWMQIQVRTNGGKIIPWTALSPRQALTPAPYALYAPSAGTALATAAGAVGNLSLATGAVTFDKIADGTITAADLSPTLASNTFWRLRGNVGTLPGHFLGTRDNQPLEFQINGQRALLLEPGLNNGSPNLVGGSVSNCVAPGVSGATIAGGGNVMGDANRIDADYGSIAGGGQNLIEPNAPFSTISGGYQNTIQTDADGSTISGGSLCNIQTNATGSTISGGYGNTIQTNAYASTIGGGNQNTIQTNAYRSTISGGSANTIWPNAFQSTIGGGFLNTIQPNAEYATISGGIENTIQPNATGSTISGGLANLIQANVAYSMIAGGSGNTISATESTISGGSVNTIQPDAYESVIAGGANNTIQNNAAYSTIAGGIHNTIQTNAYECTIGGGNRNVVDGYCATIPGGYNNSATGNYSLAAGNLAHAAHDGTFVWADGIGAGYGSTSSNQFCVRASGGVQLSPATSLYCGTQTRQMLNLWSTNYGIGVQAGDLYFRAGDDNVGNGFAWYLGGSHNDGYLNNGTGKTVMALNKAGLTVNTVFVSNSDRNLKENFAAVSPREVLDKVTALPISRWNFKGDAATPHVGPMAQDFHAAFALGADDKHIATVDADGVALAAIQGLNQKLEERLRTKDAEIQELRQAITELKQLVNQSTQ